MAQKMSTLEKKIAIEDLFSQPTPRGWTTYAEYDVGYFDKIVVQYKNYFNDKQLLIARRNHSPLSPMVHFAFNNVLQVKHADYGKGIREDHKEEEKKRIPVIRAKTNPVAFSKAREIVKSRLKGEYTTLKDALNYVEEKITKGHCPCPPTRYDEMVFPSPLGHPRDAPKVWYGQIKDNYRKMEEEK